MAEDPFSSPSSNDKRRLSRRQLRLSPRRRFSERAGEVDTILEEASEEEKQEIEPCDYETMFVETVGEHSFFRRRRSPGTPQSPLSCSVRDVDDTSFALPSLDDSPSSTRRCLRTDWEEESDEEGVDVHPSGRSRLVVANHHRRRSSIPSKRKDNTSGHQSLEWRQYKAILSKNFTLYNSLDIYILAIFIIVGMLIVPHQYFFVTENQAKSYHSWNLAFPGSFGLLENQNTDFWVKLFTGHDSLTPDSLDDLVSLSFGSDFAESFFSTVDKESLTSQVKSLEVNRFPGDFAMNFLKFQNDIVEVGQRLLRHPIPTPKFGQFVWMKSKINGAMKHFNFTETSLGTLHIAPPFPDFEDYLMTLHPSICYDVRYNGCDVLIRVHETVREALDFVLEDIEPTWAILDFSKWENKYEIRMNPSVLPSTPAGEELLANSNEYQKYYTSGFLTLQKTIDEYAFVVADRTAKDNCYRKALRQTVVSLPMPTHAFRQNTFLSSFTFLVGLACIATFLAPMAKLVLAMVGEREKKLKAMLNVAGVREWLIDLSWLSFATLQFLALSFLGAVLLKIFVLDFIPFWKLIVWMAMTAIIAASFSFFFGIVFEDARLAAALAPSFFLATSLPRFLVSGIQQDAKTFQSWVGLFPGSAVCFAVDSLLCEYRSEQPEQAITFFTVVFFLLVDSIICVLLGLLLASIDARSLAMTAFKRMEFRQAHDDASVASHPSASTPSSVRTQRSYHQSVSGESKFPMIYIQGLVKKFRRSDTPTIDGIDFTFYRGEIGALLGHNGAGKSTLAWMMAGLMRPSSGDCIVQGVSLYEHWARKHVGVGFCPQDNILYEKLTVYQNIAFFAKLHGAKHDRVAVERRARVVGLQYYLYTQVNVLSYGNKRKLSFAIARYGRRFGAMILDEPFAGQDFESRKLCWKCLQKDKESCAVVLITHDVVEAEQRADQYVSSMLSDLFLNHLGKCYCDERRLVPCFWSPAISEAALSASLSTECHRLDARLAYSVGNSYVYHVPSEGRGTIPILLSSLDQFVKDSCIASLKLEAGSLEDLCRVLSDDVDDLLSTNSTMASTEYGDNADFREMVGLDAKDKDVRIEVSWITQVILMCWKRWQIRGRQGVQTILQLFLFAILVALALGVLAIPTFFPGSSVELAPAQGQVGEKTSLVVGGGATLLNPYTSQQTMRHQFDAINATLTASDVSSRFEPSVWNSSAMTRHLNTRRTSSDDAKALGAFVLFDVLPFNWDIDWPYYQKYFLEAEEAYEGAVGNKSIATDVDGFESLLSQTTGGTVELSEGFKMATLFDFFAKIIKGSVDSTVRSELLRDRPRRSGTTRVLIHGSIHHNSSLPHSVAKYNKAFFDSAFYACSQRRLASAKNNPLPMETAQNARIRIVQGVLAVLLLLVPLCSFATSPVVFHTEEKNRKASFLQLKTGVSLTAFWVSNYLSDMELIGLLPFIGLGVMTCYGENAAMFVGNGSQALCTFALLLGFSLSVVPFSYLVTRQCRSAFNAQVVATVSLYATGLVPLTMIYSIETIGSESLKLESLRWMLRISPAFGLGEGLVELCKFYWLPQYDQVYGGPFAMGVSGKAIMSLYGSFLPFFVLFLFLERYGDSLSIMRAREWLSSPPAATKHGAMFSQSPEVNSDTLGIAKAATKVYVRDLTDLFADKVYFLWQILSWALRLFQHSLLAKDLPELRLQEAAKSHKVVLYDVNLFVAKGETLAIVGASGSGKSTLLGLLGGLIHPSRGCVETANGMLMQSLLTHNEVRIGFCPQTDPFWDYLTGRETLVLYGRVCGIPENQVNDRAATVIKHVDLDHHADKLTLVYCGGNRRKLALGISMIGNPAILLIDESSSGLDPLASMRVWKSISDSSKDHAVVLATHSVSEAEALATSMATISQGHLRPRLVSRKNQKVSVDILFRSNANQAFSSRIMNVIDTAFPGRVLLELSPSLLSFSCCSLSLCVVFDRIQSEVLIFDCVESFRLCQGGLELDDFWGRFEHQSHGHPLAQDLTTSSETSSQTENRDDCLFI